MSSPPQDLHTCPQCGGQMDISAIPPFTRAKCPHCAHEARVKTRMGKFDLLGRLGIGGMSYVFAARDEQLQREVAVKILNEEFGADPDRIAQFEREAKITASLTHPNVVRIFTAGEDLGRYFIAMELVRGDSLETLIRRHGAMDEGEVLRMAIEVVRGLVAAHEAGLIHRDIKPGNILIDETGRPRIVDFGLALLTEEGSHQQEIWATPYYVPPETLEGQEEDFRSDMYALGATLYHALAGRPPCPDDSLSVERLKVAKREIEALELAAPQLSRGTLDVVGLAMAHAPEDRFESYEMMLESLKLAAHALDVGEAAPPIYGSRRALRRAERDAKRKKAAILASIAVFLVLITGASVFVAERMGESEVAPVEDAGKPERQVEAAPEESAVEDAGQRILALYEESRELISRGEWTQAAQALEAIMNSPDAPVATVCWAAFEASACHFQAGESGEARQLLQRMRRYLEEQGGELDGTAATADRLSLRFIQMPPVKLEDLPAQPAGIEKLGYFVAALKDWEQGQFVHATRLFQRFVSLPLTDATEDLAVYRSKAEAYIRDAKRLVAAEPAASYQTIEEILGQRSVLDASYLALETRGRAKFQIREWNLALARRQRELREQAALEGPEDPVGGEAAALDEAQLWEQLDQALEVWHFEQGLEILRQLDLEASPKARAYYYLVETALNFQLSLEGYLEEAKPSLVGADGEPLGRFAGLQEKGLRVELEGESSNLPWADLSADQMHQFFLFMTRNLKSDFEKNLRYEQLIAFNYLVGDRQRAVEAAARLKDENFQRRWNQAMEGVEP